MLTTLFDVTPSGQSGVRLLGSVTRGKVMIQVQGPGFIRLSDDPNDLLILSGSSPGGFMVDSTMGVQRIDWDGEVWAIAGGGIVSTKKPLVVNINYSLIDGKDGPRVSLPVDAVPDGYVALSLEDGLDASKSHFGRGD